MHVNDDNWFLLPLILKLTWDKGVIEMIFDCKSLVGYRRYKRISVFPDLLIWGYQ